MDFEGFLSVDGVDTRDKILHGRFQAGIDAPGLSGHVEVTYAAAPHARPQAGLDGGLGPGYLAGRAGDGPLAAAKGKEERWIRLCGSMNVHYGFLLRLVNN